MNLTEIPRLCDVFRDDFLIGAAVNPKTLQTQRDLLATHFNSVTAENEMKFERLQRQQGHYTFDDADRLMAFAEAHSMEVRGHTLVWHNQTPSWVFEQNDGSSVDRDTLLARMKAHIDTVVTRYKGKIAAWDVVNEAISDKTEEYLRSSKWLEIIGEEFIAKAFAYAHEADPKALLFYNDYNESNPDKREKIYRLVRSLKEQDVPIHGVGLQGHWNLEYPTVDHIREAIERYASLDLTLHITELDVSMYRHRDERTDLKEPSADMLTRQAERYREIFAVFKEYRDQIANVTFWGAADDYTWLDNFPVVGRKNWPLPFDIHHQPKPAFWEMIDIAKSKE